MAGFYIMSDLPRSFVVLLFALTMIIQCLALILTYYRYPRDHIKWLEILLELIILIHIFHISLPIGQVMNNFPYGFMATSGHIPSRYIMSFFIGILAVILSFLKRDIKMYLLLFFSFLTVPLMEDVLARYFSYILIGAVVFWAMRGLWIGRIRYREGRDGFSVLFIKGLIDSLDTGIIFLDKKGDILLVNEQMQRLMQAIGGRMFRNALNFYRILLSADHGPNYKRAKFGDEIVYILSDDRAWTFTKSNFIIKNKEYTQINAFDITKIWELTESLQQKNDILKDQNIKLRNTIDNLEKLSHEKELQRAQIRAHDILSQWITLVIRDYSQEKGLNFDLINSFSENILKQLKMVRGARFPKEELGNLIENFNTIGVDVNIEGDLPKDHDKALLFVDIIREGITNGVKHGLATKLSIGVHKKEDEYFLEIKNNGKTPGEAIIERGGLSGMRNKLRLYGGLLKIETHPIFILSAQLPGGQTDV